MKFGYILLAFVAVVLVSGCAQQGATNQTNQTPPLTPPPPSPPPSPPRMPQENVTIIAYAPTSATVGVPFTVSWQVLGPEELISHTAIHYDYVPHPGTLGENVGPPAGYAYLTPNYASGSFSILGTFTVNITPAQAGALYWRAHAIAEGNNYWTPERSIFVESANVPATEFAIDADDSGFYYANNTRVTFVSVKKGETVKITFNVRPTNVYHGGLDFRGCGQTAGGTKPGGSASVQFSATNSCTITSYWPLTNVAKADLNVIVGTTPGSATTGGGY